MNALGKLIIGATGLIAASCPLISLSETHTQIIQTDRLANPTATTDLNAMLTPDRTRQLRELRQWLEKRRMLRGQQELRVLGSRQLLTPLGQRYAGATTTEGGKLTLRRLTGNGNNPVSATHQPLDLRVGTPSELDAIRNGTPFRFGR